MNRETQAFCFASVCVAVGVWLFTWFISTPSAQFGYMPPQTLLNAVTTGTGSVQVSQYGVTVCTVYPEWGEGTSAGIVNVEEAANVSYAGTWGVLQTVMWSAASATDPIHLPPGAYGAVRMRIVKDMVGGTFTGTLICR